MAEQLAEIQTQLWVLTLLLVLVLVLNLFISYVRSRDDLGYRKMRRLSDLGNHAALLASASDNLRRFPQNSLALMYKATSLLALGKLTEARETAEQFKIASPTMRSEAISLIETIDEKIAAEA